MAKATFKTETNDDSIPRPLNCFLLYRIQKQKEIVAKCPGANHRDISKIIAKWWKEATEEDKKPFREQARIAKQEHYKRYPDYKYAPKKKVVRKRAYIRKNKHENFTSRSEENNKFMEMIYNQPDFIDHTTKNRVEEQTLIKNEHTSPFSCGFTSLSSSYANMTLAKEECIGSFPFGFTTPSIPETYASVESPKFYDPSLELSINYLGAYYSASPSLSDTTYSENSFIMSPYAYPTEAEYPIPALDMSASPIDLGSPYSAATLSEYFNVTTCTEIFDENTSLDAYPMFSLDDLSMNQPIQYIDPMLLCNKTNLM
ncbi:unnamed protein product [Rhizopus stolonifer]